MSDQFGEDEKPSKFYGQDYEALKKASDATQAALDAIEEALSATWGSDGTPPPELPDPPYVDQEPPGLTDTHILLSKVPIYDGSGTVISFYDQCQSDQDDLTGYEVGRAFFLDLPVSYDDDGNVISGGALIYDSKAITILYIAWTEIRLYLIAVEAAVEALRAWAEEHISETSGSVDNSGVNAEIDQVRAKFDALKSALEKIKKWKTRGGRK